MIGLLGIPYDEDSSFLRGAAEAPPLIRQALFSPASNLSSESGIDIGSAPVRDEGDLETLPGEAMRSRITESIGELLDRGLRPFALGGDHSITYPILRAFRDRSRQLTIVHIDAHGDIYDEFEGNRFSHACPFARIMEEQLAGRLIQIGVRTLNRHQRDQIARFGVETIEMKDWRDDISIGISTPVYLSFDIDGLDPAFAPGVSHPEPGGFSTRQAIDLIRRIEAPIVGADIVEFNPRRDVNGMTAVLCAKLVKEIAAKMLVD
ncbi:MAG: agmatinase [Acidobacteriota bacterium]|nr:MAG: agmatinase [Acidobacteriota bacterium]